jgi:hypothetical protein
MALDDTRHARHGAAKKKKTKKKFQSWKQTSTDDAISIAID